MTAPKLNLQTKDLKCLPFQVLTPHSTSFSRSTFRSSWRHRCITAFWILLEKDHSKRRDGFYFPSLICKIHTASHPYSPPGCQSTLCYKIFPHCKLTAKHMPWYYFGNTDHLPPIYHRGFKRNLYPTFCTRKISCFGSNTNRPIRFPDWHHWKLALDHY